MPDCFKIKSSQHAGVIPDVLGPNGKPANTFGEPILHTSEMKRETLQPGEMVVVGQTAMGVAGEGAPWYDAQPGQITIKPTGEKTYTYLTAVPGHYRIRHLEKVISTTSGKQVLYTGYLPLEIVPPAASGKP
jgi:hypothetical protein